MNYRQTNLDPEDLIIFKAGNVNIKSPNLSFLTARSFFISSTDQYFLQLVNYSLFIR